LRKSGNENTLKNESFVVDGWKFDREINYFRKKAFTNGDRDSESMQFWCKDEF
jgi:hypothetical protein